MAPDIVKECDYEERGIVVRTNSYGRTLQHFLRLFDAAREDFPDLKLEDVEVVQFGGERISRIFGIQFPGGGATIPGHYTRRNLEPVRS